MEDMLVKLVQLGAMGLIGFTLYSSFLLIREGKRGAYKFMGFAMACSFLAAGVEGFKLIHPSGISIHISPSKPLLANLPSPTVSVGGVNLMMGDHGEAEITIKPGTTVKFSYEDTLGKLIADRDVALNRNMNDAGGGSSDAP
jgi:hypothetical protein